MSVERVMQLEKEQAALVERMEPAMVDMANEDPKLVDWFSETMQTPEFISSIGANDAMKALWLHQIK